MAITLYAAFTIYRHHHNFTDADIVIARTLEMLSIAVRGRGLCRHPPSLVYESLDIHRLLLKPNVIGKTLRALEGWLSKRASLLMTSSPAFIREYFEKISQVTCPILLVENKVYEPQPKMSEIYMRRASAPWRIGWFGAIRCRKSLSILTHLVQHMDGAVEVIIRGKPALDQFEDFYIQDDLQHIYHDVHFTWAIDMFEEGLNSSWLLPNRVYEGGRYGSVPIAQSCVETGRYLKNLEIGVILDAPLEQSLLSFFQRLKADDYTNLQEKSYAAPAETWVMNNKDSKELIEKLASLKRTAV
jgi:succinoglycan biosynthesis protein ExoL